MIHKYQEIQNCDIAKVRLLVRVGSEKEKKYENGITHLLEHMNLFFAEKKPFELSVRGTTDFECTMYEITCINDYSHVVSVIDKIYSIINGELLRECDLPIVKQAVLKEIEFQMNDIYYRERNNLFNSLLPEELREKMPVGMKEVIETLSFEQIIEYQKNSYKDFAICLSSRFNLFDEEINLSNSMPKVKKYIKNKKSLYWTISAQVSKKKSVSKSIYFESIKKYDNTKEYLINEFIKIYFFMLFDNMFCEKLDQKGIVATEAIVYENIIVDEMCVVVYELEILKGIDEELMEMMVMEVLRDIYSSTEIVQSIFHVAKKEFFNIMRDTTFFEKCKQKFLHGVNMFLPFDEREFCYEFNYLDICNMAEMYLSYKSM